MRMVFFCNEAPFPPNHGGRVDVWRRLRALKAADASVFLVFWCGDRADEQPSSETLSRIGEVVEDYRYFSISRSSCARAARLVRLWRWPSHVASRVLADSAWRTLLADARAFGPEAVWLDGLYAGVAATMMAEAQNLPMFYRSHNVEHLYMRRQVAKANSIRDRLAWGMNLPNLGRYETTTVRRSRRFYDISIDDLAYWGRLGMKHGEWLPPLIEPEFAARLSAQRSGDPNFDVGYLGNLFSPNNVDGVLWFLDQVVPRIRARIPRVRVSIAGSRPVEAVRRAASVNAVTLTEGPADVVPVLRDAKVLVNPVFVGSGVNVKSVEMLFSPAELVATSQGLAGLPGEVTKLFRRADDAEGFANAVIEAIAAFGPRRVDERAAACRLFSFSRGADLIASMRGSMGCEL